MDLALEQCIGLRLRIDSLTPLRISAGEPSLLCVCAGQHLGVPPLVAIRDEAIRFGGQPMEFAAEVVLSYLAHQWRDRVQLKRANLVASRTQAGRGDWEHLWATWDRDTAIGVEWSQMFWTNARSGSVASFAGLFGLQASRVLAVMRQMDADDRATY